MSEIRTELDRIISQVEEGHSKATAKGATPQSSKTLANLLTAIDTIPKASAPTLQSKTVSPSTSAQTVKPDSGYDGLSQVTVNAMTTATQATPSITVDSAGKITASATQTAGYVAAGTKSATKQLTAQAAQTITPGTADKTIASGRYLTGAQTIKGDANLVAGNIKSGVSIFGVAGNYEGSGGSSGGCDHPTAEVKIYSCRNVYYTGVENGVLVAKTSVGSSRNSSHTIQACCNMPIVCGYMAMQTPTITAGIVEMGAYSTYVYGFTVPDNSRKWEVEFM